VIKTIRRLLAASFVVFLQVTEVPAQMMAPAPFETPVPEKWRAPLARFLAHIAKDELVSDAMFYAGGKINSGDVILQTMGMRSVPTFFHSRHQVVGVIVTVKGLLVSSSPAEEPK
jgi:hypothetical protein